MDNSQQEIAIFSKKKNVMYLVPFYCLSRDDFIADSNC